MLCCPLLPHARAGENSPVKCEIRCAAIYANHCLRPNARVETWPVLNPGPYELRQHMMIVAIEPIDAGAESKRAPPPICTRFLPPRWLLP